MRTSLIVKWLLAGCALVLLGLVIGYPLLTQEEEPALTWQVTLDGETWKPVMVNPRFQGQDDKNQPYTITAAHAVEESEDLIRLKELMADITTTDGQWLVAMADRGAAWVKERRLLLEENVRLMTGDGYEMTTARATVDFEAGTLTSRDPVKGHGPMGRLTASGLAANRQDSTLTFTGPVKLVIYPQP